MSEISVNLKDSPQVSTRRAVEQPGSYNAASTVRNDGAEHAASLELMQQLSRGHEAAMNALLERHGEMLARLVGRLTAWSADHEDVFQEVLLNIWQKAGSYNGSGSLEGWLRRLTVNRCHNHLRRQNSLRHLLVRFADFQKGSGPKTQSDESNTKLQIALSQLSINDRTVLILYYLEEMNGEDVAEMLGIRTETLHVRLCRARKKLKSLLSSKGDV